MDDGAKVALIDPVLGVGIGILLTCAVYLWQRRKRDRYKWCSAGGLVLNDVGEVAIVLQKKRKKLRWTLPKGRIDRGESAETAALREVFEETGLSARIIRPLLFHEGPRHFTYYFEMALVGAGGAICDETRKVRFVSLFKAARKVRSQRDLSVLRRLIEIRTRVAHAAS
jgi:8-oxo-dGTP pyrophosphatase MutT (NUDIX family)